MPGYEGVVTAGAGRAHEFAVLFGGERPAFPAVPVATHGAAMLALQGIFAALVEREHTGCGQRIETSLLRALSVFDLSGWAPGADRALRLADAPMLFYTVARTRDGVWLQFSQNSPRLFRAFLRALELEHLLEQEPFRTAPQIADPGDARALRAILLDRVGERSWDEWRVIFAKDPDVSAEPFAWPGDALAHPQLMHTGDSIEVDDLTLGRTRQLGPLATLSAKPATGRIAAEHGPSRLLQGVTVLELATWIATPMATALLAELGARVIKIEPLEGDPMRGYGPVGLKCVQGKESIALDLKTTEGRDIVHRLVGRADALVHNYRPGVPERLGIDDATLRALNPGLIYLYAASYGSTGPMSARPAFHVTAGAICGGALAQSGGDGAPGPDVELSDEELAWWSQRLTRCNEANPDFNAALVVAAAVTMALYARARTGDGQTVETRMMAANAYTLSEHFIDYPGRPPRVLPDAGLHGLHALYRLYQAQDGWIFIAASDDRDFARLCEALGLPRLPQDPRFSTHAARALHDAELGRELEAVFAQRRRRANATSPPRVSHACRHTKVLMPPTSSTRRGPRSWASSRMRARPGSVRIAATAASCAPNAMSAPSVPAMSPARRLAASWPSSATPMTRSRSCCPTESWAQVPDDAERELLRQTFDRASALYQRARPGYPVELIDHLLEVTQLPPGAQLVEIGCATGTATLPLAERGFRITCIELGSALAAAARRNLAGLDVEVVEARFEDWEPDSQKCDMVFAATAWHWIDPRVRYQRAADVLSSRGYLAFWDAVHVIPYGGDPFFEEIQEIYDEIGEGLPPGTPLPRPGELDDRRGEIAESGRFDVRDISQFDWETTYDADGYIDLLNTFSGHIAMEEWQRERLYGEIRRRLAQRPDGRLRRHWGAVLHIAQRTH